MRIICCKQNSHQFLCHLNVFEILKHPHEKMFDLYFNFESRFNKIKKKNLKFKEIFIYIPKIF